MPCLVHLGHQGRIQRKKWDNKCLFPLLLCNHCTPITHLSSVAQLLRDSPQVKQQGPHSERLIRLPNMGSRLTKMFMSSKKRQSEGEATGLPVQCKSVKKRITWGPALLLMLWCCKSVFCLKEERTLAYCIYCKEKEWFSKVGSRRERQ